MPDIGATVRTKTLADGTVSGIVASRMFSDALPQGVSLPAISYRVVDTIASQHLGGIGDVAQARVQVDCYANTRAAANSLADAVRLALHGTDHELVGSQYVLCVTLPAGDYHGVDRPESGSDQWRFITSQDFVFSYRTTTS